MPVCSKLQGSSIGGVDSSFLRRFFCKLLSKFHTDRRSVGALAKFLSGKRVTVATACSGSEGPFWVTSALEQVLVAEGIDASFIHVFACEICEKRRSFIRKTIPKLKKIFPDVTLLGERRSMNTVTGLFEVVDHCDLFVAGFSCKSVSFANNLRLSFANCCLSGDGTTGGTFGGVYRYIDAHHPKMFLLENVKGIQMQVDDILCVFSAINYFVFTVPMNSMKLFLPQNRARLWFIGFSRDFLDTIGVDIGELEAAFRKIVEVLEDGNELMPLGQVLLPETHPAIDRYLAMAEATPCKNLDMDHV